MRVRPAARTESRRRTKPPDCVRGRRRVPSAGVGEAETPTTPPADDGNRNDPRRRIAIRRIDAAVGNGAAQGPIPSLAAAPAIGYRMPPRASAASRLGVPVRSQSHVAKRRLGLGSSHRPRRSKLIGRRMSSSRRLLSFFDRLADPPNGSARSSDSASSARRSAIRGWSASGCRRGPPAVATHAEGAAMPGRRPAAARRGCGKHQGTPGRGTTPGRPGPAHDPCRPPAARSSPAQTACRRSARRRGTPPGSGHRGFAGPGSGLIGAVQWNSRGRPAKFSSR